MNGYGLVHRWFAHGEGWAYADALPSGVRDAMVAWASRWMDSPDPVPRECAVGAHAVFFRIYPEDECLDPLARDRHPFIACVVWCADPPAERDAAFHRRLDEWFNAARRVTLAGPSTVLSWNDPDAPTAPAFPDFALDAWIDRPAPVDDKTGSTSPSPSRPDDDEGVSGDRKPPRGRVRRWWLGGLAIIAGIGSGLLLADRTGSPYRPGSAEPAALADPRSPPDGKLSANAPAEDAVPPATGPATAFAGGAGAEPPPASTLAAGDTDDGTLPARPEADMGTDQVAAATLPPVDPHPKTSPAAKPEAAIDPELAKLTNRLRELLATGDVVTTATAKRMEPGAVHVAFFDELARRYAAYWERYRPADETRRPVNREEYAFLAEPGQLTYRAVMTAFRRFAACLSADTDDPAELLRVAREHLGGK